MSCFYMKFLWNINVSKMYRIHEATYNRIKWDCWWNTRFLSPQKKKGTNPISLNLSPSIYSQILSWFFTSV